MNQTFEWNRFLRLLRAHWAENWKSYAWFFAVAAIVNGVFLVLALSGGTQWLTDYWDWMAHIYEQILGEPHEVNHGIDDEE